MRPNRLRQKLNAGEPTIGTHILSSWPTLVELIGEAENYDYVEFTAEYAPFTMYDLDNLGRAFELKNLTGMIKIEQKQYTHQAMRAIGSWPTPSCASPRCAPRHVSPAAGLASSCGVTSAPCWRAARRPMWTR